MKAAAVISLAILSFCLATDIYTPSMPEIAHEFHETSDNVQRSMSYFLLGALLSCVMTGLYADRWGKKRTLLLGMLLAAVGSILTIFCPSLEWLIFGRFLQGIGSATSPVIGFAAIHELYSEKQANKIYGLLGIFLSVVPAIAPFLGGIMSTYLGWRLIFVALLVLFLCTVVSIALFLPASLDKKTSDSSLEIVNSYKDMLTSLPFLALVLLCPMFNSVEWFYLTFLPFYMEDQIGLSPEAYGFIVGVLMIWFGAGSYLGSKIMNTMGVHKTIRLALCLGLFGGVLLSLTAFLAPKSIIGISTSLSFVLLAFGILFPSTMNSALSLFKDAKTRASSLRALFGSLFAYVGSYSAEWVDESNLAGFAVYVMLACVLAIAVYGLRARRGV